MTFRLAATLLALATAASFTGEARADTTECTEIASMGTVLAQQGVYCLKRSFSYSSNSLVGITVEANNVTIDCNGNAIHRVGAFPTSTVGIQAVGRNNLTLRNCTLEGFQVGIKVSGDGIVVEDSVVRGTSNFGIQVTGNQGLVRRNQVVNIGGVAGSSPPEGMRLYGTIDVLDNVVDGVAATSGSNRTVWGMRVNGSNGGQIARNRIQGLSGDGTGATAGILVSESTRVVVLDNTLVHAASSQGTGLVCGSAGIQTTGNHLIGWDVANAGCLATQNVVKP